ncbi:hypothetical protein GUJ93_ZPchr0011g27516 [Zizania palustris]|uniref:Uncharacterized protein n=1 Tax=Zizania palustris TaxID=103762 RepID=A0A8J5WM92_ZIZPA|nr:hypothetical protein GUJ93_ZPchr0011g27516 [Zizania palustris]
MPLRPPSASAAPPLCHLLPRTVSPSAPSSSNTGPKLPCRSTIGLEALRPGLTWLASSPSAAPPTGLEHCSTMVSDCRERVEQVEAEGPKSLAAYRREEDAEKHAEATTRKAENHHHAIQYTSRPPSSRCPRSKGRKSITGDG